MYIVILKKSCAIYIKHYYSKYKICLNHCECQNYLYIWVSKIGKPVWITNFLILKYDTYVFGIQCIKYCFICSLGRL